MPSDSLRMLRWLLVFIAMATAAGMGIEATRVAEHSFYGMSERGDEVALVSPGGPADRAGLRPRDRLLEINGTKVEGHSDPLPLERSAKPHPVRLLVERGAQRFETVLEPTRLPGSEQAWQLAHFLIAILTLLVGTIVYSRKPTRLTTVFFGICLALGVLLFHPWTPPSAWGERLGVTMVDISSILLPGLLLHFFLLFPYERTAVARRPGILAAVYGPGVILFFLASIPAERYARLGVDGAAIRAATEIGFALNVIVPVVIAIVLFVRTYRASPLPSVRRKLKVTLWGTLLGLCPILLVVLVRSLWPSLRLPGDRLATLMIFFLPASFGYAIVRHGVFEIEFIVKRSLVYSGLTSLFALAYFVAYFVLARLLRDVHTLQPQVWSLLVVLFVLLVMSPIRSRIQDRFDRWIYPDRYDTQRALRESALQFREARSPEELGPAVLHALKTLLGVEQAALFRPAGESFVMSSSIGVLNANVEPPRFGRLLIEPLFRIGAPMLRGDLEAELPYGFLPRSDLDALRRVQAKVLVPLLSGGQRLGILVLGERTFGEAYSSPDLLLLEGLAAQATLALENALLMKASEGRESERREMAMAHSLQQQLLPHSLPKLASLEIAARNLPCDAVGGDYYDLIETRNGGREPHLTFAIGDVSGKGVPAALLMANVQASFRAEASIGRPPNEVLAAINRRLCAIERPERFVSLFCAQLDPDRRTISFANAGHPAPVLLRASGVIDRL